MQVTALLAEKVAQEDARVGHAKAVSEAERAKLAREQADGTAQRAERRVRELEELGRGREQVRSNRRNRRETSMLWTPGGQHIYLFLFITDISVPTRIYIYIYIYMQPLYIYIDICYMNIYFLYVYIHVYAKFVVGSQPMSSEHVSRQARREAEAEAARLGALLKLSEAELVRESALREESEGEWERMKGEVEGLGRRAKEEAARREAAEKDLARVKAVIHAYGTHVF